MPRTTLPRCLRLALRGLPAAAFGLALLATPNVAQAQWGFGLRGGLNMTPDAIQFGGHAQRWLESESLPGLGRLAIEPSFEIGLGTEGGGDYTTVRINGNVMLPFAVGESDGVRIHPLAGLGFTRWSIADCPFSGLCSFSNVGLNLGGGVTFKQRFGVDAYIGLGSIGDFALMGKVNFGS